MSNTTIQAKNTGYRARLRRVWHEQWGSQGIEAAGAALAAAIIIGALLLIVPDVGSRVERALSCAASVLTGGGSCASGSAASGGTPGEPATSGGGYSSGSSAPAQMFKGDGSPPSGDSDLLVLANHQATEERCGFWCQAGGFFKGIGEGAVDLGRGIADLAVDGYGLATGDPETIEKYRGLGQALAEDPLDTARAMGEAVIAPMVEDWQAGRYGEAIGRGLFDGASTIVGDKGLSRLGRLGRVDDIARATNRGEGIPCARFTTPTGRGPGLAAPLACGQGTPARPSSSPNYEVGFEARLQRGTDYPDVSDRRHFAEGNRQLHQRMQSDPEFAQQMEQLYPGITEGVQPGPRGAYPRRAPTPDVTWHHHPTDEGLLQLVPRDHHQAPGPVQDSLHPDGRGGMDNWGGGR